MPQTILFVLVVALFALLFSERSGQTDHRNDANGNRVWVTYDLPKSQARIIEERQ